MRQQLINFYLEFVNDFLTIDKFAEYHGLTDNECIKLLKIGRKYHEEKVEIYKLIKT